MLTQITTQMKKQELLCKEVTKYTNSFEEKTELQFQILSLEEINLQTVNDLSIKIADAYMDCKANYPEVFPTVSTQEVKEEPVTVDWLLWEKIGRSFYHAFITLPNFKYGLTISKEEGRWLIWGEDHDATDYEENLDWQGKVVGFKTLWEAKEAAEGIKEWMQECAKEAWGYEVEAQEVKTNAQDAIAELEANCDRLNAKAQSVLNKYQLL